jgi:hypothetical protein
MLAYIKSFSEDYEIGKMYELIVPYYNFLEEILDKFGVCYGVYKVRVNKSDFSGGTKLAKEFTVMESITTRHYVEEICLFRHSYNSLKNVLEWLIKQNEIKSVVEILNTHKNDIYIGVIFPLIGKYASVDMYIWMTQFFRAEQYVGQVFIEACKHNKIQIVEIMFHNKATLPFCDLKWGMREAARHGSFDVVNFLLTNADCKFDNCCIGMASEYGHYHVVKLLLKHMDPTDGDNYSIRRACALGRYGVVKLLLDDPRVDPSARNNEALSIAVNKNDSHLVRILMNSEKLMNINSGLLYKSKQMMRKE